MQPIIKSPETLQEWDQYYECRWRILRQPWQQPRGSEKDDTEQESQHRIAIIDNKVIAVGRLHLIDTSIAQIRYMAVIPEYQQHGIGQAILQSLESFARKNNVLTIQLNARESAIHFYQHFQYQLKQETHTLFNCIRHFKMIKYL